MFDESTPERGMHGSEAVAHFLQRSRADYELIEHAETFAAADEARVAGSAPAVMAKTVLLHDRGGFRAAIVPASERVDLHKARRQLHGTGHMRLARENEIEAEFPAFDTGALPPFSALIGTPEILDQRLLAYDHILCSGGDHRHTLRISPREIERLGEPLVADVCLARPAVPLHQASATEPRPEGGHMSATKKPATRAPRPRATPEARERAEDNVRRLEHIAQSLEAAQIDLTAIGGSLGTGVSDLRRDVSRLLRDARRDLAKMRRAVQRDLDRLQKDLTAAATARPPAARRATTTRTANRQTTASSH